MPRGSLNPLEPEPIDERSPLLGEHINGNGNGNGNVGEEQDADADALEAQAEQERREYEVGATVVAEEPSTRKLLVTMGALWLGTFFAALGMSPGRVIMFVRVGEAGTV